MNLTAITEYEEVVLKHFTDSVSLVKAVDLQKVNTFIDVGTGAGFPGIPLKIVFPHLKCVSRAVANLSSLSEYCLPFVKKDGYFISYKSTNIDIEIEESKKALYLLGGKYEDKKSFLLPDSDIGRSLIIIKKERGTPSKYPRKAGLPAKEPLGQ